jgi:hypothetical protein
MSGSYEAGTMPDAGAANSLLVSDGDTWSATTPANTRTALGLGTAAVLATTEVSGSVALHTTTGEPLKSAAYIAHGTTASTTIPINTSSAALNTAAYVATGTAEDTIPVLVANGALPAVSGVNLTSLKKSKMITIQQAATGASGSVVETSRGSSSFLSGTLATDTWHIRPLNTFITHFINGASDAFGVSLTGVDGASIAGGGVGAEIKFTEVGTYRVSIHSHYCNMNEVVSRLIDLDGNAVGGSTAVVVQGTTGYTKSSSYDAISFGSGIFVIGVNGSVVTGERALTGAAQRRLQFQYAFSEPGGIAFPGNHQLLGRSFSNSVALGVATAYLTNVWAWVDIEQLA